MIKNIIFDWSGVIKDAVLSHLCVVNKIFEIFGVEKITLDEMKENWVQPYMLFYKKYIPDITFKEEQAIYEKVVLECGESNAYPGIIALIKKFKMAGIKMVVLSSDLPDTLLPELERFGLKGLFEEVITNIHNKTDSVPEIIKKYNFNHDETVFIGDSNHEVEAGKKANIKTIAVTWGFSTEKNLIATNPDFLVHNLDELDSAILK
jgi:HAD superfamily hydrolase (TIGR01509 family)